MAELTKASPQPPSTVALPPNSRPAEKLIAGEAIGLLDACQIHTDGLVMLSNGAANTQAAAVHGFALRAAAVGEPVTLGNDFIAQYATGLTPGAPYFLSGTVEGGLADAASTGGLTKIAHAWSATLVRFLPTRL